MAKLGNAFRSLVSDDGALNRAISQTRALNQAEMERQEAVVTQQRQYEEALQRQQEEALRQQEARQAEKQRQQIIEEAPGIVEKVLQIMQAGTKECILSAQDLLGDRKSESALAVLQRKAIGDALVQKIDGKKELSKQRTPEQMYTKLQNFLHSASLGFEDAEALAVAAEQADTDEMFRIMRCTPGVPTRSDDERAKGALAAAIAFTIAEESWTPALWTKGFDAIKALHERAEEIIRLRNEQEALKRAGEYLTSPDVSAKAG